MLLFSQASIDKWRKQGGKVDPVRDRRHDLSDAIAIPGLRSFSEATDQVADAAVLYGLEVRLGSKDASESILLGDSYVAAERAWLDLQQAFNAAVAVALSGLGAPVASQAAAVATGTATFKNAGTSAKSAKVKAE